MSSLDDAVRFSKLAGPSVFSPLHTHFAPLALVNRAFRQAVRESGRAVPLVLALQRGGRAVSVYRTECFEESAPEAALNPPYAERLIKFLLWQRGGWRLTIGGPRSVGEHIRSTYSLSGARAFDADFMSRVYERPFTVDVTDVHKVPESFEGTVKLGGHLNGCRIGFDLGASDRKVSAVIDGKPVFTEEVAWDPRNATDPAYHYHEINAALRSAAAHLPRVDAIGGSSAGIFINNRPRVGSIFRGIDAESFESRTANLFMDLKKAWGDIPFEVVNDGEVTALAGSMSLEDGAVLGVALGSSEAGGYVTSKREITTWLNELAFCPIDADPDAPADEWSGDRGCGVQYLSQQGVFRLAPAADIPIDESLGLAEKLKSIQALLQAGNPRAQCLWETIGSYVGYAVAHYSDFYELRHVLILGRVTSGDGGNIILEQAQRVLKSEFPEAAEKASLHLPDEETRRVGQAVAAASLPALR
jgi:predicted NBD/HSP70 family sugar kinase